MSSPTLPPAGAGSAEPVALYGPEFQRDPAQVYRRLRRAYGPAAPVLLEPGVTGYVILDHEAIVAACRDTATWSHDSRRWRAWREGHVPDTSELLPMLRWRPNMLFADGEHHTRLRRAVTESLSRIDQRGLEPRIRQTAGQLIDAFAPLGHTDLITQYATQLPLAVILGLFGADRRQSARLLSEASTAGV